mgnify:CR=1 FL=1
MQDKFTEEEYTQLKHEIENIKTHLPHHLVGYIWGAYRKISGNVTEPQPCNCPSSGNLWLKAVDTIRNYIKENE